MIFENLNCSFGIWIIGIIYSIIFLCIVYKGQVYLETFCQKISYFIYYIFFFLMGVGTIKLCCPCILMNSEVCNNDFLYVSFYLVICYIGINNIKDNDNI